MPPGGGPFPAVLYLHGSGGDRTQLLGPAAWMAARGVVTMTITMPEGSIPADATPKERLVAERKSAVGTVVAARRAVDALQSLPEVDDGRIGLVGWSAGARIGAILAGVDRRIEAFDLLSGGAPPLQDYVANAPPSLKPAVRRELGAVDPLRWIAQARKGTVLLQDGRKDEVVPAAALNELAKAAGRRPRCAGTRPGARAGPRGVRGAARLDGREARRRRPRRRGRQPRAAVGLRPRRARPSSAASSCQSPAAAFARACSAEVAPAITDATPWIEARPPIASSRIVCPRLSANASSSSTRASRSSLSRPSSAPLSRAPSGCGWPRRYFPVRSPLSSGKYGDVADPELGSPRDDGVVLAVEEAEVVLHGDDGTRARCGERGRRVERTGADVREAEPAHLALDHELVHLAQRLLERRHAVGPVVVPEVDVVAAQAPERGVERLPHVLARASWGVPVLALHVVAELRRDDDGLACGRRAFRR